MAEEKNNLPEYDASAKGIGGKNVSGRIFSAVEADEPKINLDQEIEKNIKIRVMPRRFKVSTGGADKKTKIVGAIIMVVGILVLAAAVYLAYVFLINPQAKPAPATAPAQNQVQPPANTVAPVQPTPTPATPTPVAPVNPVATTTPPIATTTSPVATTTLPINNVATSSASISGAPAGALITNGLSTLEKFLFELDPAKTDSDGDGYSDQSEAVNLYNPAGAGKITDNPHVAVYQNAANKYSVAYPKIWQAENLNSGDSIVFMAADHSLIQIISQPNSNKEAIKEWYNRQFPDTPAADADLTSRDGWQGIFNADRIVYYLADNNKNFIYVISYVPANESDLSYYNIFLLMINSFAVK